MVQPPTLSDAHASSEVPAASRRLPWRLLILGTAVLAMAIFIATQVIGILFAIVLPPAPPVPPNSTVMEHSSAAHGVDDWLYGSTTSACDVVRYFVASGGECRIAPLTCGTEQQLDVDREGQHVARCTGESYFSIFAMRWDVSIATGYRENGQTHFRLTREIFWTGAIPPRQMPNLGQ